MRESLTQLYPAFTSSHLDGVFGGHNLEQQKLKKTSRFGNAGITEGDQGSASFVMSAFSGYNRCARAMLW